MTVYRGKTGSGCESSTLGMEPERASRLEAAAQGGGGANACCGSVPKPSEAMEPKPGNEVCCASLMDRTAAAYQRPGYRLCSFVSRFVETAAGEVPVIKTRLGVADILGGIGARAGGYRDNYRVAPGLYAAGTPGPDSMVLVTANYKLTFDALRKELEALDTWILVVDTDGINVWCASGKKTFSAHEVIRRVELSGLKNIVTHRKLVLPQLSAAGVSAREVKEGCGFQVVWGPIRAHDLRKFIALGMRAEPGMRQVSFRTWERTVLVPVEISHLLKPALLILLGLVVISGIGPGVFSFGLAWSRGVLVALALLAGIFCGTIITPVLLPWLPGVAFSQKGAVAGLIGGLAVVAGLWDRVGAMEGPALVLITATLSSYLAMNFTGATPFTSPSGVEKEMRRAIPIQAAALLAGLSLWIGAPFVV